MEKKTTKKFEKQKDGKLKINIEEIEDLTLTIDGEIKTCGTLKSNTVQLMNKFAIPHFREFLVSQIKTGRDGLVKIEESLSKLKDVNVEMIDEKLLTSMAKSIDKGSKVFKKNMQPISHYLLQRNNKLNLLQQKGYTEPMTVTMEKDLEDLDKALL